MTYKVLIVDDEKPAREELKYILAGIKDIEVCGECSNGNDALQFLKSNEVNLVFLDIEMPGMGGVECAKKINKIPNAPKVVFSTGFEQFAIQAFELEAFDYILKPYVDERIYKTIKRFFDYETQNKNGNSNNSNIYKKNKITLQTADHLIVFDAVDDIVIIKTEDKSSLFYTTSGIIKTSFLLKEAEEKLGNFGFIRTHKSFIVNVNMIREVVPYFNDTFLLIMKHYEKEEVPVSRHFMKSFKNAIGLKN